MSRRVNLNVVHFDGSDDSVVVGDHDAHSFTNGTTDLPFTITAWIFVPDVSEDDGPIVSKADISTDTAGTEFLFRFTDNGKLQAFLYDFTSADVAGKWNSRIYVKTDAVVLTDATWHHVALTYDASLAASGLKVYVDGVLKAVTALNSGDGDGHPAYVRLRNTTTPLVIGGQTDPASDPHIFEEKMAEKKQRRQEPGARLHWH